MGHLDGKVAIVTGAGGGLGRAHALLLAHEGAQVVVNDLGGDRDGTGGGTSMADGVVAEIIAAGGQAVAHYGSVSDNDAAAGMVAKAVDSFGRLDILINNAGILRDKSFKNMTDAEWDIVIDVHLRGTYLVTKHVWQHLLAQGQGGRIIMTSSTSGLIGNFGQTNYGAAKAGIAGFMRVLALEGMKNGITVNVLAPAALSRMTEDLMPESPEVAERLAPEKVSPAVVWLCTDSAAKVTGRQFCVSGNRVSLLSWQVNVIAEKNALEAPWGVSEIGDAISATIEQWPKLLKPMEV
ncbi:MAG: SDR family NAD(P)-dependent oxidoreductase [Gammaproteobacteria bacterium]|jgi:NAD(P)-dependent dehydrogenase (short-subunit alcohol dehydrogenase family)|nr:SDR family NAD(P)-dependent oxidoreductase [Gammaproteobacteria bacterium]MCH1550245.1 SDR family NAD(P)-dependent oxidoreductase [Pseudomonadales bacterium]